MLADSVERMDEETGISDLPEQGPQSSQPKGQSVGWEAALSWGAMAADSVDEEVGLLDATSGCGAP